MRVPLKRWSPGSNAKVPVPSPRQAPYMFTAIPYRVSKFEPSITTTSLACALDHQGCQMLRRTGITGTPPSLTDVTVLPVGMGVPFNATITGPARFGASSFAPSLADQADSFTSGVGAALPAAASAAAPARPSPASDRAPDW